MKCTECDNEAHDVFLLCEKCLDDINNKTVICDACGSEMQNEDVGDGQTKWTCVKCGETFIQYG